MKANRPMPGSIAEAAHRAAAAVLYSDAMTLDAFNHRQVLAAVIWPYDQTVPVVLSK